MNLKIKLLFIALLLFPFLGSAQDQNTQTVAKDSTIQKSTNYEPSNGFNSSRSNRTSGGVADEQTDCPNGYTWDEEAEECIKEVENTSGFNSSRSNRTRDPNAGKPSCPLGYSWSDSANKCVKDGRQ